MSKDTSIAPSWVPCAKELLLTSYLCYTCQCVYIYVKWSESHLIMSLRPHGLYSPWNTPGQNTGVGSLSLLQGIFPTQGLSPGLLHYKQFLYQLSHRGSPRMLEWVAYPFSSRSSQPRNWNGVSCNAGRFFTSWAVREAYCLNSSHPLLPSPHPQAALYVCVSA